VLLLQVLSFSSLSKEFFSYYAFNTHAGLLRQAFAHCAILSAAAGFSPFGLFFIPMWPVYNQLRLKIFGLVSLYLTNYLIFLGPFFLRTLTFMLFLAFKKVYSQVLLTNTPLDYVSFDLHALNILLAFTLSQNQTLLFEDIPICYLRAYAFYIPAKCLSYYTHSTDPW
jgi:hypothetical protein